MWFRGSDMAGLARAALAAFCWLEGQWRPVGYMMHRASESPLLARVRAAALRFSPVSPGQPGAEGSAAQKGFGGNYVWGARPGRPVSLRVEVLLGSEQAREGAGAPADVQARPDVRARTGASTRSPAVSTSTRPRSRSTPRAHALAKSCWPL